MLALLRLWAASLRAAENAMADRCIALAREHGRLWLALELKRLKHKD